MRGWRGHLCGGTQPVAVRGEGEGVDDVASIKAVQALALRQVPQHRHVVLPHPAAPASDPLPPPMHGWPGRVRVRPPRHARRAELQRFGSQLTPAPEGTATRGAVHAK